MILFSNFWWWTWLHVSGADRLVSSQVSHGLVWHRFRPQALAEALKVNKTVTDINLADNRIGKEGAKAWCLARGSVAASKRWNKMEWSGVPVVFQTCETLVLLDRCRASGSFQKSHWNGMETRWKWDGGGCSDTCKAIEKISNTSIKQYLVLAEIHLDFDSWSYFSDFWWWTWLYVKLVAQIAL